MHKITQLWGQCPVQAFGFVNGRPFYFRARFDEWRFSVAPTLGGDPVKVQAGIAPGFSLIRRYGRPKGIDAGWMSHTKAQQCIHFAVQQYMQEQTLRKESHARAISPLESTSQGH